MSPSFPKPPGPKRPGSGASRQALPDLGCEDNEATAHGEVNPLTGEIVHSSSPRFVGSEETNRVVVNPQTGEIRSVDDFDFDDDFSDDPFSGVPDEFGDEQDGDTVCDGDVNFEMMDTAIADEATVEAVKRMSLSPEAETPLPAEPEPSLAKPFSKVGPIKISADGPVMTPPGDESMTPSPASKPPWTETTSPGQKEVEPSPSANKPVLSATPKAQDYSPPSGGYRPPSSGGYRPPSSGGYRPPSSGGYRPPSSGGYRPPSSGGYRPPSSGAGLPLLNQPSGVALQRAGMGQSGVHPPPGASPPQPKKTVGVLTPRGIVFAGACLFFGTIMGSLVTIGVVRSVVSAQSNDQRQVGASPSTAAPSRETTTAANGLPSRLLLPLTFNDEGPPDIEDERLVRKVIQALRQRPTMRATLLGFAPRDESESRAEARGRQLAQQALELLQAHGVPEAQLDVLVGPQDAQDRPPQGGVVLQVTAP
jgi:hypothetical protein